MKVTKDRAIAFLLALGFSKAVDWEDDKILERFGKIPTKIDEDEVPEGFEKLYSEIANSPKDEAIEFGTAKKKRPSRAKPKKEVAEKEAAPKPPTKKELAAEKKAAAAASKKEAATAKPKAAEKAEKVDDKPKKVVAPVAAKSAVERDSFGSKKGSISAKVNEQLSGEWVDELDIAKNADVTLDQARGRLYYAAATEGILECRRLVQYRIVAKK